jgi:hypothetical protein
MLFPKVLLNLQFKQFHFQGFHFIKRVSYKYPIFKSLLEKLFQILYQALKDSFKKIYFQNTILQLFRLMQALFAKENISKGFIKFALLRMYFKIKFKNYFIEIVL